MTVGLQYDAQISFICSGTMKQVSEIATCTCVIHKHELYVCCATHRRVNVTGYVLCVSVCVFVCVCLCVCVCVCVFVCVSVQNVGGGNY